MCGIAGFLGAFDPSLLDRMGKLIAHRGPDGEGTYFDPDNRVGLAHRRLAIIDLSPTGHQPMWDLEKRACIVFNGEIYNYRELREALERDGFRFAGTSDTEVLLNLYLRDGKSAVTRLNGIFGFAIWDTRTKELFCARDPMGVKPFYWTRTATGFGFASELKGLLPLPDLDRSIDARAAASYITLLWAPGSLTMFRGVEKLRAGHTLSVRDGETPRSQAYSASPFEQPVRHIAYREAKDETIRLLRNAVQRQLVSDVPIGGFLSGGLDSSAVATFAVERLVDPLRYPAFTIGFSNKATLKREGFDDDLPFAETMARRMKIPLHTVQVGDDLLDQLDWMVWHLDEPTPDPAALSSFAICRAARECGVKVLLSGTGGDDVFTGYRRHRALVMERWWAWLPCPAREALMTGASRIPQQLPLGRRLGRLFRNAGDDTAKRLTGYFSWVGWDTARSMLTSDIGASLGDWSPDAALLESLAELPGTTTRLNQMLHLDQRHFLADHNLNYTDKMGMACGVEVRVPFLDLDLVNFAATLPPEYKQRGSRGKAVLGDALRGILPDAVIDRRKTGFAVPLRTWMQTSLRDRLQDLASGAEAGSGLFSRRGLSEVIASSDRGLTDVTYPLLGVLCVESWIKQFAEVSNP